MIDYDIHLHTSFSSDSEEPVENQINKAINLGLKGLCITDHLDIDYPDKDIFGIDFLLDVEKYVACLSELKEKYSNKLELLIGMEIGLRNEKEAFDSNYYGYKDLIDKYPFDYIIGSTHCLDNCDPYGKKYWENRDAKEGLDLYFQAILDNVKSYEYFDSLGHLDYLVRYVNENSISAYLNKYSISNSDELLKSCDSRFLAYDSGFDFDIRKKLGYAVSDYSDVIDEILKQLINSGRALELNTAGLKYGIGFAHPKREILVRYRELGGELITVGSDAHKEIHLAYEFDQISEYLKSLGFKYYFIYKNRTPKALSL